MRITRRRAWVLTSAAAAVVIALTWLLWPQRVLTADELLGPAPGVADDLQTTITGTNVTLRLHDEPLPVALRRIADAAGVQIELDSDVEADPARLSLQLQNVPAAAALSLALQRAARDVRMVQRSGVLRVEPVALALADGFGHPYDLRRLRDHLIGITTARDDRTLTDQLARFRTTLSGNGNGGVMLSEEIAEPGEEETLILTYLLHNSVEPDNWREAGGLMLWGQEIQGIYHVHAPADAHQQIRMVLYDLWLALKHGRTSTYEAPLRAAARARLESIRNLAAAEEPSFGRVLETLASDAGLALAIDWKALSRVGINDALPVRLHPHAGTTAAALHALANHLRATDEIAFTVDDAGVLVVTSKPAADADLRVRVYAVEDMIDAAIDWAGFSDEPSDRVADLIRSDVTPDDWREAGGLTSSISPVGNTLVIAAPLNTHDAIEAFLHRHRSLRDR